MKTINKRVTQGLGLAPVLVRRASSVALDWDQRQKSRFDAVDSSGEVLTVFLPRGSIVRGGDVLVADDGSLVRVQALDQPVMVVRAAACSDPGLDHAQHDHDHDHDHDHAHDHAHADTAHAELALLRAAYHLGNRHVAVEITPDHLQIEPDHVLADMLRRMGLDVVEQSAPFEPEAGAYHAEGVRGHAHGHGHGHDDDHRHDHDHGHGHDHGH
jgi:urease accessory protein